MIGASKIADSKLEMSDTNYLLRFTIEGCMINFFNSQFQAKKQKVPTVFTYLPKNVLSNSKIRLTYVVRNIIKPKFALVFTIQNLSFYTYLNLKLT